MVDMINRKLFFTLVVSTILAIGIPSVLASSSNDLLRMDVKKSAAQDTVDVTFYTTGNPANSVVTRKSGNSYVVLLPNVSGNQSVVPSLGGVKDLVSDVSVKNVDDGIGGYTKVTFTTTKPVRIQTFSKQTAPLTTAQQGYKNLLAQSNNIKPVNNTSAKQPAAQTQKTTSPAANTQKQASAQTKPAAQKTVTPQAKPSAQATKPAQKQTTQTKTNTAPKAAAPAPVKPAASAKPKESKVSDKAKNTQPKEVKPQTKPAEETKTIQNTPKENEIAYDNQADENVIPAADVTAEEPVVSEDYEPVPVADTKSVGKKIKKSIKTVQNSPLALLAGAFCLFAVFIFAGLANIITKGVEDKRNRLKEYMEEQTAEETSKASPEFQAIIEDENSNWQEKYKRYTKIKEDKRKHADKGKMSYVTDAGSSRGRIVSNEQLAKNKMQETISRMEHTLSQTPSNEHYVDFSDKYYSEDDRISKAMSEVKLKSFAKSVNLSETGRNLISFEELEKRKKTLKEGKFVRMTHSNLSMSKRKSASAGLNFANIVRNNEHKSDVVMNKEQEEYILSSINEYLDLLDAEQTSSVSMVENSAEISKALESASQQLANSKSLVTNPMASQKKSMLSKKQGTPEINGLNIKSNYIIDSDKSIYMVDLDGASAIIGKVGEEIFVLKKFDKVVNKPMQVRLDYGNTYIVKVGNFKCLVDVTDSKMGTLLEI